MTDIRSRLNARLRYLRNAEEADAMWVEKGADPTSKQYERSARNLAELREIEGTLATMQLADAQISVASAQREIAEAQRQANEKSEFARTKSEEIAHWTRRLVTTFSIANGAGLVATLNFALSESSPSIPENHLKAVLMLFFGGAIVGASAPAFRIWGLLTRDNSKRDLRSSPLSRAIQKITDVDWLFYAGVSAASFIWAIMIVLGIAEGHYFAKY